VSTDDLPWEVHVRTFLSYCFDDAGQDERDSFVAQLYYCLRKQDNIEAYFWNIAGGAGDYERLLDEEIRRCEAFLFFVGRRIGDTQRHEVKRFIATREAAGKPRKAVAIRLPGCPDPLPIDLGEADRWTKIFVRELDALHAENCAREVFQRLELIWVPDDGLPVDYPFSYEKGIIEEFSKGGGQLSRHRVEAGCPRLWPTVERPDGGYRNPIEAKDIGAYRASDADVVVDPRGTFHDPRVKGGADGPPIGDRLTFREAGPRELLYYPTNAARLPVGVLVSGGIAPGINAVLSGIVERHTQYARGGRTTHEPLAPAHTAYEVEIVGYRDGFTALVGTGPNVSYLDADDVRKEAYKPGSIIGTSRAKELLAENPTERDNCLARIVARLRFDGIKILYVIGGDGSMRAAHAIQKKAAREGVDLAVVGIPKTMDNDILWVWQSFGFLSAVERAREITQQLHAEAVSNPRLCVIQLYGSDSGFIVSHTALGSGVCDLALIPEVPFTMRRVVDYMRTKLQSRFARGANSKSPYGLLLMAETAVPQDVEDYYGDRDVGLSIDERKEIEKFVAGGRRVRGQTPDDLRSGALKIVSRVLQREIRDLARVDDSYWEEYRVFNNEPRHLIRAIPPSAYDVAFGKRLGTLAVDNAMAGYRDFMISQWLTEYVLVPLSLVVLGRKRVRTDGIFWKSVVAATGQPDRLHDPEPPQSAPPSPRRGSRRRAPSAPAAQA
jgi:6-phosphofructokinase 1